MKKLAFLLLALIFLVPSLAWSQERKKIIIATDATWPPMQFIDENKELAGFEIDLMKLAAEHGGYDVEIKNIPWKGIFMGLANDKYDAISSGVTVTEERKKNIDFSDSYYTVVQSIIVPKDSNIKTLEDLKGKNVGAQIGTTGAFAVQKIEGATLKSYNSVGLAVEAMLTDRLDAVVCDAPVAADYVLTKERYNKALKIGGSAKTGEEEVYAVAVKKGNTEILDLINNGLREVKKQGLDKKLEEKWMSSTTQ